jgi:lysophospholipase L1-like esterase
MVARRLLPALLALLAFAAAGELAARRWLVAPFSTTLDRRFGFVQRPGARVVQSREGWGAYTANADGFLGHAFTAAPPGSRALLMGDSFTQGLQVREGERYSEVAERLVPGLSVLNVAVAGHSPIHYALYMPRFQAAFHPALAIVQIDDGDLNEMEDARANAETMDEFYARGSAAAAERATSGPVGFVRGIFRRSALLTELRSRVQQLTKQERARLGQKLGLLHPDLTDVVALPATPRAEAMLDSLIGEVERVNPHTILVYVPHIRYFGPVPHVAYPVRRAWYHALAARRGLPIVDPTDAMLAEFARTHEPLQGFLNARPGEGHMNARGHRLLGELLAETIRRQTAPDGPWSEVRIAPVASTRGAATGAARTAIAPGARP